MRYTVILDPNPESGAFTVTVPALPGCITEGDTFDDAVSPGIVRTEASALERHSNLWQTAVARWTRISDRVGRQEERRGNPTSRQG